MKSMRVVTIVLMLLCCLALSGGALSARLTDYALPWYTLGGAGGQAESASYGLSATLGQTAMGVSSSTSYQARAGFWYGVAPPVPPLLLLPLVLSSWSG
ncbi:MAG: hypothetical protein ABIK79_03115 [Chloroflexota bacterium]